MGTIRLGFLGNGNMGYAILKGLIDQGQLQPDAAAIYDPSPAARERAKAMGCQLFEDETALVKNSDTVLVAVKPQYAKALLEKIGKETAGKLILSIVAGYDAAYIRSCLGCEEARILRIMPNTPAMVGAGVFGMDKGTDALPAEKELVETWFSSLGVTEWIDEHLFAAITGLSGSGPAYVAIMIEAMADAGVRFGLFRDAAVKLAAQTVLGTAKQVLETGIHPALLKDAVCSPAGTTIEGVHALEEAGFRSAVMKAIEAGTNKASSLK